MNTITLTGTVSEFKATHQIKDTMMYKGIMKVVRTSGTVDSIPFVTSDSSIKTDNVSVYTIKGEVRTRNYQDANGKNHKNMFVKARDIVEQSFDDIREGCELNHNKVELQGYLVHKDTVHLTPAGKTILDFIIATNHAYGKSSYISCIAWGLDAEELSMLDIGAEIALEGRFQSREYVKQIPCQYRGDVVIEGERNEVRTAYEISVRTFKKV